MERGVLELNVFTEIAEGFADGGGSVCGADEVPADGEAADVRGVGI
jgi:hypothetical protein